MKKKQRLLQISACEGLGPCPKGLQLGCSSKGTSAGLPWRCRTLLQPGGVPIRPLRAEPPPLPMAKPLLPSAGRCPPCTHGCWPPASARTPPLQAVPAGVAGGNNPSCPQQTPHISPQKPPARLLGVLLGKASRDGAEPGKLASFVAGAPPAPLGPLPPGGKASKG